MRPTIDQTLMSIARAWERRSTCARNHVGTVIAKDGRHIGSGYNGAPAGMPHCIHETIELHKVPGVNIAIPGRLVLGEGCRTSIHAEANALAYCARDGIAVGGATIYTTLSPCYPCSQLIIAAGLVRVVYDRTYRDSSGVDLLRNAGIEVAAIN